MWRNIHDPNFSVSFNLKRSNKKEISTLHYVIQWMTSTSHTFFLDVLFLSKRIFSFQIIIHWRTTLERLYRLCVVRCFFLLFNLFKFSLNFMNFLISSHTLISRSIGSPIIRHLNRYLGKFICFYLGYVLLIC